VDVKHGKEKLEVAVAGSDASVATVEWLMETLEAGPYTIYFYQLNFSSFIRSSLSSFEGTEMKWDTFSGFWDNRRSDMRRNVKLEIRLVQGPAQWSARVCCESIRNSSTKGKSGKVGGKQSPSSARRLRSREERSR